ncbi:MAG: DUF488 family protein [Patescibacteria group bacterium]|nr:DUF488 family protein [Patescibacteria group bacterium]
MRRIRPEFEFDLWIPILAPSAKLLKSHQDKKIDWKSFEKKFTKEVLDKQKNYLNILTWIAEKHNVTLLCWEKKGENCHRLLVAKKLREINPDISVRHV